MNFDDMDDDTIIQMAFDELSDDDLKDPCIDYADDVYMNGTIEERGKLAKYMQGELEKHGY